jgi:hypothetical protein
MIGAAEDKNLHMATLMREKTSIKTWQLKVYLLEWL